MNLLTTISNVINSTWLTWKNRKVISMQCNNVYTTGYNLSQVTVVAPYGMYALPKDNSNALLMQINESAKGWVNIGYLKSLPSDSPISIAKGEFAYASDNWGLRWNNDGLRANKLDNPIYLATLPSGEWTGYLVKNRITEVSNVISGVNTNYTTLMAWATLVTAALNALGRTEVTALSQTPLQVPQTLAKDTNYITSENYLLNNKAIVNP